MDKYGGFKEFALAKLTSIEECLHYERLLDMSPVISDMSEIADDLLNYAGVYAEFDCEFSNNIKSNVSNIIDMAVYFSCVCECYQSRLRKHELSMNRKIDLE